ncbi:filamentous hemagglutinin N-terminal domain-containing protein [Candidatus Marithioploca araucensis]|uniref:Filamentous hemagglutinin N-terminal domain-containing protein n=1 Tax=Candidatus Marithioploca araucensis TaxID=70273 RepID=A0ABT7VQE5_9GAMM|nr:filamentous hemagglutinin N-terminal domain-containing protein [Candidatus Marithioploca araucensis]
MRKIFMIALLTLNCSIHAEVVLDGTVGKSGALPGPNYLIGANLGQQQGNHLFHSFQDFNLNSHESATFSGANSIRNIISRVTGGNPSQIDGLIRSTIPNADIYFINPYGILFGPNASLDVQGSFHASTADYLRLKDGGRFDARHPNNSILTIAPIEAFGFMDRPAPISLEGRGEISDSDDDITGLNVSMGKTLSLIGGKIKIKQGTFFKTVDDEEKESITRLPMLSAPHGRVNLISVASQGEVNLGDNFVNVSSFSRLADIHLTENALVQSSGEGGGDIFIRGGQFFVDNSAIEAKTLSHKDGGVIDIRANSLSLINGASINGNTVGTGKGSNIDVQATDSITVAGENNHAERSAIYARSGIYKERTDDNLGEAGKISLDAKNISFKDGAIISTSTYGGGNGGQLIIKAEELASFVGEGTRATTVAAATSSKSDNAGDAGHILIEAQNISFKDGSYITTSTKGNGKGGNVTLKASQVTFKGESSKADGSDIYMIATDKGDGGDLLIEANNIFFTDGAYILSKTRGKGNAGTITLHADQQFKLTGVDKKGEAGKINVSTSGSGNAGHIFIKAQNVLLTDGASLTSTSFGSGKAGHVHLHATGTVTIAGANQAGWRTTISSSSNPKKEGIIGGEGGSVTIEAEQLIVKDGGGIAASSIAPKGIQSSKGGNITIRVKGAVELSGVNPYGENEDGFGSGIYARSIGNNAGDGGTIILQAGSLMIKDGAVIKSGTDNNAQGGNIEIQVNGTATITGDASHIQLKEPSESQLSYLEDFSQVPPNQSSSGIYASSDGSAISTGNSGTIELKAEQLALLESGRIEASTSSSGIGGYIHIHVDGLVQLSGEGSHVSYSGIFTKTTSNADNAGHGGNVELHAGKLIVKDGAAVSASTFGAGKGGQLDIKVKGPIHIIDTDSRGEGSFIGAGAWSFENNAGDGGTLTVEAKELHLIGGAVIETGTTGKGEGGNIIIKVTDRITLSGKKSGDGRASRIVATSEGKKAGDAGDIVLETGELYLTDNTTIAVSSRGTGKGGNLTLTAQRINVTERSNISASSAGESNAGNIILSVGERLYLENGGTITTATTRTDGGNITINTPGYFYLVNGKITTSVNAENGNGGNITLNPEFIVLDGSKIIARAVGGNGGNINITTTGICKFPPESKSPIDASSQYGLDGVVVVDSPDTDITGQLLVLPKEFLDADSQLPPPCRIDNRSNFVVTESEGAPISPDDLLPSGPLLSNEENRLIPEQLF